MKTLNYIIIILLIPLSLWAQSNPPTQESHLSFRDKLFFNGSAGMSFGSSTQIQLSPGVGYKFSDRFGAGVGINYIYSSTTSQETKFSQSVIGPRVFALYKLLDVIYLTSKYEFLSYKRKIANQEVKENIPAWQVGLGYSSGGRGLGLNIELLYDLLHDENKSLAQEAYSIQGGVNIGF